MSQITPEAQTIVDQLKQAQAGQTLPPNPYEGLDVVNPSVIQGTEHIKAAILGKPKSGKTWFACTAPGNTLHYDFDDRWMSLQNHPNKDRIRTERSLKDTLDNPWVFNKLEKDLSILKYRKMQGKPIPDNYVFDTVTHLLTAVKHQYLKDNPKDGRRIKLGGGLPTQVGVSYDLINVQNRFIEYLVTEYSLLGNVIFTFHERDEKDKAESTPDKTVYTGLITVDPQYIANILTVFNEVFRISVTGDYKGKNIKYTVSCQPNNEVIASTTLLVDSEEPPNIEDMLTKHNLRKKNP